MRMRLLPLSDWLERKRAGRDRLRPDSPMRLWQTRRQERPETAAQDLLGVLTDPKADWADRALGYAALRELELSPAERAHANQILCRGLEGVRKDLLTRIGSSAIPIGLFCFLVALQADWNPYSILPVAITLGIIAAFPGLAFAKRRIRVHRQMRIAQRTAAKTLAQTGDWNSLLALAPQVRRRFPVRQESVQAIQTLLLTITADSYRLLPADVEAVLLRLVLSPHEPLALGALDALERLGDGRYAATLEGLLPKVRARGVRARLSAVLSLLPTQEAGAAPVVLSDPYFESRSREHPLKRWLSRHQSGKAPGSAADLLSALTTPRCGAQEQAQGFQALSELTLSPSEQTQTSQLLAETLQFTGANSALFTRMSRAAALGLLTGLVPGGIVGLMFIVNFMQADPPFSETTTLFPIDILLIVVATLTGLFALLTAPLYFLGLTLIEPGRLLTIRRAALFSAERIGGPECIPALNEHVVHETPLRKEALLALRNVLPRVTEDWYGRLPAEVIPILLKMAESSNANLACPAIDAIGRAGGGNCLEQITLVAQRASSEQTRAHAVAILPILQERRTRESSSATLLRASQPADADHLLKPVYASEPDTTHLLRASSGMGNEEGV